MLTEIRTAIQDAVADVASALHVGPALSSDVQPLPSARAWLMRDKEVTDTPQIIRELTWGITLMVGHQDGQGLSQAAAEGFLDALRAAFIGWMPDTLKNKIKQGVRVPEIKLLDYRDKAETEYLIQVVTQAYPQRFSS